MAAQHTALLIPGLPRVEVRHEIKLFQAGPQPLQTQGAAGVHIKNHKRTQAARVSRELSSLSETQELCLNRRWSNPTISAGPTISLSALRPPLLGKTVQVGAGECRTWSAFVPPGTKAALPSAQIRVPDLVRLPSACLPGGPNLDSFAQTGRTKGGQTNGRVGANGRAGTAKFRDGNLHCKKLHPYRWGFPFLCKSVGCARRVWTRCVLDPSISAARRWRVGAAGADLPAARVR